jgi:hypothetical protein
MKQVFFKECTLTRNTLQIANKVCEYIHVPYRVVIAAMRGKHLHISCLYCGFPNINTDKFFCGSIEYPTTGILYLASKTIATVIKQANNQRKKFPHTQEQLQGMQERISSWPTSQIRLASKLFLATKLTILIIIQAFYLGTTYLLIH